MTEEREPYEIQYSIERGMPQSLTVQVKPGSSYEYIYRYAVLAIGTLHGIPSNSKILAIRDANNKLVE